MQSASQKPRPLVHSPSQRATFLWGRNRGTLWVEASMAKVKFPTYKIVPVSELVPYARNSRTHSEAQIIKVMKSIHEFGFLNPVIIDIGSGIVAGHCRVLAAERAGLAEVPCIEAAHLTPAQVKAYVIADNRLALDAGWDDEVLRAELIELQSVDFPLNMTGLEVLEIEKLIGIDFQPQDVSQSKLDTKDPIKCPKCGHEFQA